MGEKFTPSFEHEDLFSGPVAGVDEAGCGPWAGPVTAGAVIILRDRFPASLLTILNDSKKLTAKKRELIFCELEKGNGDFCHMGFGQASVAEIDQLNIRASAMLSMKRAVGNLSVQPSAVLVDGTGAPSLECVTQNLVKGDARSYSIAAASIVAKVTRDRIMADLAREHPEYAWERNAGYGTKDHQNALKQYGVTPHHRKTYKPIAALLAA